jgi:osmotically-inducible protein OsmY
MGWLQRLFGVQKPQAQQKQQAQSSRSAAPGSATSSAARSASNQSNQGDDIPPERVGLNGEYDDSGLAKRVALAFDENPELEDIDTLYVAQTGSTVVLKGRVPNQQLLTKMSSTAKGVRGAKAVDTSQVTVG